MTSGIFYIDKPAGISSFDIIRRLRRVCQIRKMGHTGTLDPFATGLSIICVGRATRLASFLTGADKTYEAKLILGKKSSTGDPEGEFVETKEVPNKNSFDKDELIRKVMEITEQIPPKYSAIKIDGKRAYQLARENKEVVIKPREIKIHTFELLSWEDNVINYRAKVSKGTYIRTLSEQIAELLGAVGYTKELRRTAIGDLGISEATPLDDINEENWISVLKGIEVYPYEFPHVIIQESDLADYRNGVKISVRENDCSFVFVQNEDLKGIGFGSIENNQLSPKMVMI